jgi:ATP-dependent helicase/nuclease subunit A
VIIPRGTEWGSAVHDALEKAASGLSGAGLRDACANILIGYERPMDADGTPLELNELIETVESVVRSRIWQRASSARRLLVEVPFALRFSAAEYSQLTGNIAAQAPAQEVIDGRIDLVFQEDGGWVIVDYKSDAAGERIPPLLMARYRGQLALYRVAWERMTGEKVLETALLFTATGAEVIA